ncbi:MAG: hypothetical protein GDA41_06810 [Rhodospirillales bacterium]|nr:hypothetical protein [Rhodospirillales bacterium]
MSGKNIRQWLMTLATIVALLMTYFELQRTADQIEGATLYQIANDARKLTRSYYGREKADRWDVLSHFHSVYLLSQQDVIDEASWVLFCRSLKIFIERPDISFNLDKHSSLYDSGFVSLVDKMEKGEVKCT